MLWGPKRLPARRDLSDMQAEGDVVWLPVAQEGPLDFAAFFATSNESSSGSCASSRGTGRMPRT